MLNYPKRVTIYEEERDLQNILENQLDDLTYNGGYISIHKGHPADEYVKITFPCEDYSYNEKLYRMEEKF